MTLKIAGHAENICICICIFIYVCVYIDLCCSMVNYVIRDAKSSRFPTRQEVDRANRVRMSTLPDQYEQLYTARDGGSITDKMQRDRLLANCIAPEAICLRQGAQVMLIKNIDESLVNGSIGTVRCFVNEDWEEQRSLAAKRAQMANTADEDEAECAFDDEYEACEGKKAKEKPAAAMDHRAFRPNAINSIAPLYPLVRFTLPDGTNRELVCRREAWKIELPNGEVQASRSQIPLILAWALSIHKAQGQTLDHVRVDLGRVFEKGQAYVALSRATTMEGLQVLNFDPNKVQAHERVRSFYAGLSRAENLNCKPKKAGKKTDDVHGQD